MPASLPALALDSDISLSGQPALAVHPSGVAMVVGSRRGSAGSQRLFGRLIDPNGKPMPSEIVISEAPAFGPAAVSVDSDGRFWVVWPRFVVQDGRVVFNFRRFDVSGSPLSPPEELLEPTGGERFGIPSVTCLPAGRCIVAWAQTTVSEEVWAAVFENDGTVHQAPFAVQDGGALLVGDVRVAAAADGRFAISWLRGTLRDVPVTASDKIPVLLSNPFVRLYRADGAVASGEIELDNTGAGLNGNSKGVSCAWNESGELLASWDRERPIGDGLNILAQTYDENGIAIGGLQRLNGPSPGRGPRVAWDGARDRFAATWLETAPDPLAAIGRGVFVRSLDDDGEPRGFELAAASRTPSRYLPAAIATGPAGKTWLAWWAATASGVAIEVATFDPSATACPGGGVPPCAHIGPGGRFETRVVFRDQAGQPRFAGASQLTPLAGGFFFNSPQNPELLAKIVDGRTLNGAFWIFAGALSDQEYSLGVHDTESGESRVYYNPPGKLTSLGDTSAFLDAPPRFADEPLGTRASGPCANDATLLCINDGQFRVQLLWTDAGGVERAARPAAFGGQGGSFYYFNPDNVEVAMKVLDGRPINGKFWVFYASLTNVRFRLRVLNAQGQLLKQYVNPPSTFASVADTAAF